MPIRCRSWDCRNCARRNKRQLLRRLSKTDPNLFITLTTSTLTAPSPDEAFNRANEAISPLIKRWRRRFPNDRVEYFLVWERTKAGWPHAHVLLKAPPVPKRWLSRTWRELTGSYIVDLQQVSSAVHAAGYLAKYLAKDPQVPAGARRWRRSAAFFVKDSAPRARLLPAGTVWHREPHDLETVKWRFLQRGMLPLTGLDGLTRISADSLAAEIVRASSYFDRLTRHVAIVAPGLL